MKRGLIIACLIGLIAPLGVQAQGTNAPPAPPPGGGQQMRRPPMDNLLPPRVLEELALTPDQKAKYDPIAADYKKDFAKWRESNPPSGGQPSSEARQALKELRKGYMDKVRAFLTDAQKTKLDQALERRRGGPGGPGGAGGSGGPPPPTDK